MGYGVLIKCDPVGTVEVVEVNGLHDMQQYVEGYIEVAPNRLRSEFGRLACVVNEEGRLHCLPVNAKASVEFQDFLVGHALVLGYGKNEDGETDLLPLDEETAKAVAENFDW